MVRWFIIRPKVKDEVTQWGGKSKFTKEHLPWILIYTEKIGVLTEARKMEKYFKTAAGKRRLNKILGRD